MFLSIDCINTLSIWQYSIFFNWQFSQDMVPHKSQPLFTFVDIDLPEI